MVTIRRNFTCKCGATASFEFSSDMPVDEISVSGKCQKCSSNIHIAFSSLLVQPQQNQPPLGLKEESKEVSENIEQAVRDLFR
ncbi:MAG: hypothetical protein QXT25_03145 [Candidatus Anstonellaceae archaeon]